ncbi:MAG: hypothetical protein JSW14_03820 [Candidatus Bathyarchaeum sp.]|nr:MAG: hypothetical protein JSW14_03820 [Candidatus Bathyarchaeum sp.]
MRKRIAISIAVVSMLLIGIMATSVFASNATLAKNAALANKANVSNQLQANAVPVTPESNDPVREQLQEQSQNSVTNQVGEPPEIDVAKLEEIVPKTYEETDAKLISRRTRFLLYTHDGKHIMWGYVGNGFFVGQDNLGKRCWGIYGNGVFAGFYDGDFFWGRYRSGHWKAVGLFGLNYSYGKYILFPSPSIVP